MKELLGEMLDTESAWIGGLAAFFAVIGAIGFGCLVIYMWFSFPAEFPWYGWIVLTALGTVGGAVLGVLAGLALYLGIVVSLGLTLAGLIIGGLGLVFYMLLFIFGAV